MLAISAEVILVLVSVIGPMQTLQILQTNAEIVALQQFTKLHGIALVLMRYNDYKIYRKNYIL